jgi:hypothetical protein
MTSTIADADPVLSLSPGQAAIQGQNEFNECQRMVNDANTLTSYNHGALTPDCTP